MQLPGALRDAPFGRTSNYSTRQIYIAMAKYLRNGFRMLPETNLSIMDGKSRTRAEALPSTPMQKLFSPSHLDWCEALTLENLVKGTQRVAQYESLYRKHDKLSTLYFVRCGQFKLIDGDLSTQRVAAFYMRGDLMGLDAIATGKHHFRLMALENSEVFRIHFAVFAETMSVAPAIQRQFLQAMGEALSNEYSQSLSLATMSLDQRFANFLLKLGEKYRCLGYSENSYRMCMSRGDIGGYIGTSTESVSRLVARFNACGATSIRGRVVELIDRSYLQALACGDKRTSEPARYSGRHLR